MNLPRLNLLRRESILPLAVAVVHTVIMALAFLSRAPEFLLPVCLFVGYLDFPVFMVANAVSDGAVRQALILILGGAYWFVLVSMLRVVLMRKQKT
jgi:hypothetical protein